MKYIVREAIGTIEQVFTPDVFQEFIDRNEFEVGINSMNGWFDVRSKYGHLKYYVRIEYGND